MNFYRTLIVLLVLVIIILLVKPHLPIFTSASSGSDALAVIHSRKSVRKYLDKPVSREDLQTILKAGMAAPTAADKRPWAFITITDKAKLSLLADVSPYGKMLKEAGAAIIVCGVSSKMLGAEKPIPSVEKDFWIQDCSAATQNILLATEALKLGAVWIGVYPMEDRVKALRQALSIPEEIIPLCIVSIGHPAGVEKPKNKYDEKNIHWNGWE